MEGQRGWVYQCLCTRYAQLFLDIPIANGLVLSAIGFVADYILRWTLKILPEDIKFVY
jgi:hypothetical protein